MAGNSGRRKPDGLVLSAPRSTPMFIELNREIHRECAIFDDFATFCNDLMASYEGQPEMCGQARTVCSDFFLYFNMCYYTRTGDYYPLGLSDESVPEYLAPHTRPANRTQP
ncbi:hypothetical protein N7488_008788 [Penicillium malachiteum]|nr:hypothetical protein N7488_008788 [Penicillium malachiteum]